MPRKDTHRVALKQLDFQYLKIIYLIIIKTTKMICGRAVQVGALNINLLYHKSGGNLLLKQIFGERVTNIYEGSLSEISFS